MNLTAKSWVAVLWYTACALISIFSIAVIAWKLLSTPPPRRTGVDRAAVEALLQSPLPAANGSVVRLGSDSAELLVLVAFTPGDCPAAIAELEDLDTVLRGEKGLHAFGIMSFSNADEAKQTQENFHLAVPILQDADGTILRSLKPPVTPWKVVVHRSDRRILLEGPASVDPAGRRRFFDRLAGLRQAS